MKKIVIAPDSFKESLSAKEVADIIAKAFSCVFPNIETVSIPLADGGEGTAEALKDALGGYWQEVEVKDPLHRPHKAKYAYIPEKHLAIIEMAEASGLPLVPPQERNPLIADSFGTGQMITHALDMGAKEFIIGIGGSATNDGGSGMMRALGLELLDNQEKPLAYGGAALKELEAICFDKLEPRLNDCVFHIACDVNNPLVGKHGASAVFGPQKGATPQMVKELDDALSHYAQIIQKQTQKDISSIAGAGAAGGMGGAFCAFFPKAKLQPGIDIVIDAVALNDHVKDADLVITGEGRMDFQTQFGKTPMGAQKAAATCDTPIIAIAGSLGDGHEKLLELGFTALFDVTPGPCDITEALQRADKNLFNTSLSVAHLFKHIGEQK
ncbi:MAG: glycerate kinase [Alphaproteobacteria bacterium]